MPSPPEVAVRATALPIVTRSGTSHLVPHRTAQVLSGIAAGLIVIGVTVYRMVVAADARYPGHADPAFYYQVGRNLATGHGPYINYIWHFLAPVKHVHHFAWDYWLPMPSLLISVGQHFQSGMTSALDVGIALSAIFAAGTYQLAWRLTRSWWIPPVAAVTTLLLPSVSIYTMRTESAIYLASFTALALSAAVGARERPWRWVLAGAFTGIAGLARNEGLLLIGVMAIATLTWNTGWRRRLIRLAILLGGYFAIMGPYMIVSGVHIGSPLPPASQQFPYISKYSQLFALHVQHKGLFSNAMWSARGQAFTDQWHFAAAIYRYGVVIALLAVIAVSLLLPRPADVPAGQGSFIGRVFRSAWLVPVAFAIIVPVFESIVTPVVAGAGSVQKSGIALAPILVIAALQRSRRLPGLRPDMPRFLRGWDWLLQIVAFAGAIALMVFPALQLPHLTTRTVAGGNQIGHSAAVLKPILKTEQARLGNRRLILMTSNPWDVSQATGFSTVVVPQTSVCNILKTAYKYGVTDIETRQGNRPQHKIEWLAHHAGPFTAVIGGPGYRLYSIDPDGMKWCADGQPTIAKLTNKKLV
jgi:hypothetical protein